MEEIEKEVLSKKKALPFFARVCKLVSKSFRYFIWLRKIGNCFPTTL